MVNFLEWFELVVLIDSYTVSPIRAGETLSRVVYV